MPVILLVIVILFQIFFVGLFFISELFFKDNLSFIGLPVHLIFVVILDFISLILLGGIYKREEQRKIKLTESTHEEQFHSLVASVRSDRHDLNNHLTVLFGLLNIKSYDAATDYIKDLIGDIRLNNQALNIHNPVLASMLFSKAEQFKKQAIVFQLMISTEKIVNILSSTDLIRLLSNLLDNAYEATLELPKEQRFIALNLFETDEYIGVIIQNSSTIQTFHDSFFEIGYSTKDNNTDNGYGLSIIQEIVKKNHGKINITTNNNQVTFEISFKKLL